MKKRRFGKLDAAAAAIIALTAGWFLLCLASELRYHRYPCLIPEGLPGYLKGAAICLLPAMMMGILWAVHRRRGVPEGAGLWVTALSLLLMVVICPIGSVLVNDWGLPIYSRTEDPADYRCFDRRAERMIPDFALDMLPDELPGTAVYRYHFDELRDDGDYDLYVELTLPEDAFAAEVARMESLFSSVGEDRYHEFTREERGRFTCLIRRGGWMAYDGPILNDYDLELFAYDEETCTLRYATCEMDERSRFQPAWLGADWTGEK